MAVGADSQNIYAFQLEDEEPRAVIATRAAEHSPSLSPDGRWIAYVSDESGRSEVYVARFSDGGGQQRVTVSGGWEPLWSRDGRELFYAEQNPAPEGRLELRSMAVSSGDALELGTPRTLFALEDDDGTLVARSRSSGATYDVSPDGTRLIMIHRPAEPPATEIVVVQNWHEELNRLFPTD